MAFNLIAKWCKGDTNKTSDTLFHYPVWEPQQADALDEYDEENLPELPLVETWGKVGKDNHDNV